MLDSNGEGIVFAGKGSNTSSDNVVADNVISNSNLGWNVYSNPNGTRAEGNVLRHNCLWAGDAAPDYESNGGVETPSENFTASANAVVDPLYVDRDARDYTLSSDSQCPLAGRPGFPALNG